MKAFVAACLVALVVAVAAARLLESQQMASEASYTSSAVNLGGYGKNKH